MIVIITDPQDVHADRVCSILAERSVAYLRFDHAWFPERARFACGFRGGRYTPSLRLSGEDLDLNSVRALWWRRPSLPVPSEDIADAHISAYVVAEAEAFLKDLWQSLECSWVPGPEIRIRQAERKVSQLQVAARLGFALPRTLVTNDPEAFLDFYRESAIPLISKVSSNALFRTADRNGKELFRFTEPVSRADVTYADTIRYSPIIFQETVEKDVELRITLVGDQVFAVAIESQRNLRTRSDWRHNDPLHTPHTRYQLPDEVEQRCLAMMKHFGLVFAAIDMILTPDGRYVFLELNPNGQFLWLEEMVDVPISHALSDLLISYERQEARLT